MLDCKVARKRYEYQQSKLEDKGRINEVSKDISAQGDVLGIGAGRVDSKEPVVEAVIPKARKEGKTANRRTKEAYNAYMREYMRKKRSMKVLVFLILVQQLVFTSGELRLNLCVDEVKIYHCEGL